MSVGYIEGAERRIREALTAGARFEEIEEYIGLLALDQEFKDALWMLAWAELPLFERRRLVMQTAELRREEARAVKAQAEHVVARSRMLMGRLRALITRSSA